MILGVHELEKQFDRMNAVDLTAGIGRAISLVQEDAKTNCPVFDGELRSKILTDVEQNGDTVRGICWPAAEHGVYVELGTGPKGQEDHEGISPDIAVAYRQSPWWIHESQIERDIAEHYHFHYIDTPQGRFYQCTGQAAQPYLYPALKNNTGKISEIVKQSVRRQL